MDYLSQPRRLKITTVGKERCFKCLGKGSLCVIVPAKLHLNVVERECCYKCGGSGFLSVGFCRDCNRKGWWLALKDGCFYCGGDNTVNLDIQDETE
jgi:hypothetical protein